LVRRECCSMLISHHLSTYMGLWVYVPNTYLRQNQNIHSLLIESKEQTKWSQMISDRCGRFSSLPLVSTKAIDIGQTCFHWLDSYSRYSFIQFAYFIKYIRHGLITQYSRNPFFSKNRARRVSIYLQYFLREVQRYRVSTT
jgi:hypothetical protein